DYNQADYEYTTSFTGRAARIAANKAEIANRVKAYGFFGMANHLQQKTVRTFGSGNADTATYLNLLPKRQTFLHQICLQDGAYYNVYDYLCQGYWLALIVLCLAATGCVCSQKGAEGYTLGIKQGQGPTAVFLCNKDTLAVGKAFYAFAPAAAVFGLYLFYLVWEASQRYTLSFIPMFIIIAVCGLPVLAVTAKKKWQEESNETKNK
ncbi:MAG: hypothetical protein PHG02_10215, partial [Oscillospiraceae bacterium]|nr:hypothetical protein [Oscillospiraceae bacterium]